MNTDRRSFPEKPGSSGRAVTLVELLVVMAVMLVVLGIALGIFIESGRAARELGKNEAASLYAGEVMFKFRETIQGAVIPSNMEDTTINPETLVEFSDKRIRLLTYHLRGLESALYQVTWSNAQTVDGRPVINESITSIFNSRGSGHRKSISPLLPEDITPSVRFSYASAGTPGQTPDYRSSWLSSEWPDLIQVSLTLEDRKNPEQPLVFQSAFIPGLTVQRDASAASPQTAAGQVPGDLG